MAKNRSKSSPFGSRKGTVTPGQVRGNVVKFNKEISGWFEELETLLKEASSMPTSALIANRYTTEYGHLTADPAAVNERLLALKTIITNHKSAVAEQKEALGLLKIRAKHVTRTAIRLELLTWGSKLQDIMNDWQTIGMYAIDAVLDHYRELAGRNEDVPFPGYMIKRKEDDISIVDQYGDNTSKPTEMVVLDVPAEQTSAEAPAAEPAEAPVQ